MTYLYLVMRKFIGIGLVLGLAVSMYVVETNDNGKSNSLTVESDYLLLNNDITNAENLIKLEAVSYTHLTLPTIYSV